MRDIEELRKGKKSERVRQKKSDKALEGRNSNDRQGGSSRDGDVTDQKNKCMKRVNVSGNIITFIPKVFQFSRYKS